MKIISDKWQVASDTNRQPARSESASSCHPSPVTCHRQRGVALVITLILLSVTLVMALAFLAISGRERGSVTTQTDTATARLARRRRAIVRRGANRRQHPRLHQSLRLRSARLHELSARHRAGLVEQHRHAHDGKPLLSRFEPQRPGRSQWSRAGNQQRGHAERQHRF